MKKHDALIIGGSIVGLTVARELLPRQPGSSVCVLEKELGWHVNLMPAQVLSKMPPGWRDRAFRKNYGNLLAVVPSVPDLLHPKLKRGEPRDKLHAEWATQLP